MRARTPLGLLLLLSAAAAGCYLSTEKSAVVEVVVSPPSSQTRVGNPVSFTATAVRANRTWEAVTSDAEWSSSNEEVATVDGFGGVAPRLQGSAYITASFDGVEGTGFLVVMAGFGSCRIVPPEATVTVGDFVRFGVVVEYEDGSAWPPNSVSWSCGDPTLVSMDGGRAQALAPGTVTIWAEAEGETCDAAVLSILDAGCEELTIDSVTGELRIPVGSTLQLFASCRTTEETVDVTEDVRWDSSDEHVATVSNDPGTAGEVRAHEAGWTGIFARFTNPDGTVLESNGYPLTVAEP